MGLGEFDEICAVLQSRSMNAVHGKVCSLCHDAWLLTGNTGGESDARGASVVLHNFTCELQTAYSPCSQFQSRGGLQAGSGLAAGDRTLGEAAHLIGT